MSTLRSAAIPRVTSMAAVSTQFRSEKHERTFNSNRKTDGVKLMVFQYCQSFFLDSVWLPTGHGAYNRLLLIQVQEKYWLMAIKNKNKEIEKIDLKKTKKQKVEFKHQCFHDCVTRWTCWEVILVQTLQLRWLTTIWKNKTSVYSICLFFGLFFASDW